jgi:hypothetical protein
MNDVITITMAQQSPTPQWLCDALAAVKPRHWLLDTIFGREVLKHRLVQLAPSVPVPLWSECHEFDGVFDLLIDELGLRGWERPKSMRARIAYFRTILLLSRQLHSGAAG